MELNVTNDTVDHEEGELGKESFVEASGTFQWCYFFLVMVILSTMYGNLMVCLAVCLDKRLQNITNYFLVSLAMTDMGVATFVMPIAIVVAYNNGECLHRPTLLWRL